MWQSAPTPHLGVKQIILCNLLSLLMSMKCNLGNRGTTYTLLLQIHSTALTGPSTRPLCPRLLRLRRSLRPLRPHCHPRSLTVVHALHSNFSEGEGGVTFFFFDTYGGTLVNPGAHFDPSSSPQRDK